MDSKTKARIRELMFFVVPDPDEIIDDNVLARSEAIGYEEQLLMKAEFTSFIESLNDWPDEREIILDALDDIDASGNDVPHNNTEWMNVCDVMGRRIRRTLEPILLFD